MTFAAIGNYFVKLFDNNVLVAISAICAFVYKFLFPENQYLCAAAAVLGIMILDLLTKLFALARQAGGLKAAFRAGTINSSSFGKGTFDKLVVFGILLIICGLAYRLTVINAVAVWFTQIVFILMFLRDILSIIENLMDAGVSGLGIFKKVISKKINEYVDDPELVADLTNDKGALSHGAAGNTTENTDHL